MQQRELIETTDAELEIRRRISASAAITFADFMEIALYHPDGYYANRRRIGERGDYFTSPTAHPLFGALICVQLHVMWQTLDRPSPFWVIESGAGDGVLANDILDFATRSLPDFASAVRYAAIDRSPPEHALRSTNCISWLRSTVLPFSGVVGCVLANELVDALPVHRFEIVAGRASEIFVTEDAGGRFAELLSEPSTPQIEDRIATIGRELPEGFRGEVNLGIRSWAASVSDSLQRGYVLTIDYGYESAELYSDERRRGTVQTYFRHTDGSSPYQRVGRQDITAHVDFSALIYEGVAAGLRPVFLTVQSEFLRSLGFDRFAAPLSDAGLDRTAQVANVRAMHELVKPDGLGRFKVLVQDRNTGLASSSDLLPPPDQPPAVRFNPNT